MNKALFLDRDGIVNVDGGYVYRIEDFELMPGIRQLLLAASRAGYLLIVITNQSGIARGMYNEEDLNRLHDHLRQELAAGGIELAAIYYCPHHPQFSGRCLCRKPDSLLFEKALARYDITPGSSWMIGDKARDIIPASRLGINTLLLGKDPKADPTASISSLEEALPFLLR